MKTRAALGILAAAGLASSAFAQESITYTIAWSEVTAGTNNPVAAPNGTVDPGEGVRFVITANITPGIGSPATYTPPPPPGNGTIAGLGSMFLDLLGTNLNGGTWSNISRNPTGAFNWNLGAAGTAQASGNIIDVQAGQFVLPGNTANSSNPVAGIWRGVWNPSSYANRAVSLTAAGAVTAAGNHSSILIQYGVVNNEPQYVAKFVSGNFGNSGQIPVAPAPSSLALLGLGALVAGRRRR